MPAPQPRLWSRLIAALALLSLAGCAPPEHTLIVDLLTDLREGIDYDSVRTELGELDMAREAEGASRIGEDRPARFRVAEFSDVPEAAWALRVVLSLEGAEVATGRVQLTLSATTSVTVRITRDCLGVQCPGAGDPAALACLGGRCADPRCTPETREHCPPDLCFEDSDCAAPFPCVESSCVAGVCFESPDDASCPAGVCTTEAGCTGCTADDEGCADGVETRCEDGRAVMETCSLGCSADVPRCRRPIFSNIGLLEGGLSPNEIFLSSALTEPFDTDLCVQPGFETRVIAQAGGGEVCVYVAKALILEAGATLRFVGSRAALIFAEDHIRIEGDIDIAGSFGRPGPGGLAPGDADSQDAPGEGGGAAGEPEPGSARDSGGGGGGHCGRGGDGGDAGASDGGAGGGAIASGLVPLRGGGGGGAGIGEGAGGDNTSSGGGGGGALQLISAGEVVISGTIFAFGGGGGPGANQRGPNPGAGAGGGAGGGVLIEAPVVTISGQIAASGGGGGGSSGLLTSGTSGAQGAERPSGGAAGTGSGAAAGGDGAVDAAIDGGDGAVSGNVDANGGGGGGGAGCIVIRQEAGGALGGELSPSEPPGLVVETLSFR